MKTMKKLVAILLAAVMVMSLCGVAFAADGDDPQPASTTVPAYDHPLTVTGLMEGDTVKFYKVIEWVGETADKSDVSGWKAVSPYDTILTKTKLIEVLVGTKADSTANPPVEEKAATGITSALAGQIAALATGGVDGAVDGTTATLDNPGSGMWMALITPADANTVYNPLFVSADYNKETDHTGTAATSDAYADAVVKKSTLTLTKTAANTGDYNNDNAKTTAIGDTVTFTVNTTIPAYGDVYTTPHFVLKDTLTDLTLNTESVSITAPTGLTHADYQISATAGGYTITFTSDYLKTVKSATTLTVTYSAVVATSAGYAINEESNDVSIEYSHNPNQQSDYDVKKDTTQHYTFTLDASGVGSGQNVSGKKTSELVKIGVDANGDPITEITETSAITAKETWDSPLSGATFGLWKNAGCTGDPFKTQQTGTDGRMTFTGLDAGTYYLKETSAPAGYVTNSEVHTVVIAAETETVKVTEWWNGSEWVSTKPASGTAKEVTYDTEILKSYTVTIDGQETAKYTFTNAATANDNDIKWETVAPVEHPFELENIKGVELPSTGGIGTTIFYISGIVLVLGAAAILVARRKAEQE